MLYIYNICLYYSFIFVLCIYISPLHACIARAIYPPAQLHAYHKFHQTNWTSTINKQPDSNGTTKASSVSLELHIRSSAWARLRLTRTRLCIRYYSRLVWVHELTHQALLQWAARKVCRRRNSRQLGMSLCIFWY